MDMKKECFGTRFFGTRISTYATDTENVKRENKLPNPDLVQWSYQVDWVSQMFNFLNLKDHPSFYLIKNDSCGKCVSVPENKDRNGA